MKFFQDKQIVLYKVRQNVIEKYKTLLHHKSPICGIDFNNKYLVSGGGDGLIKVWNIATNCYHLTICAHERCVTTITVDGDFCISGSIDTTIRMHNIETGDYLRLLDKHHVYIQTLVMRFNILASASTDGYVINLKSKS